MSPAAKRRFVGKQAQQPMHIACNNTGWYATAADKLLFHTLMTGAALPRPELLAITHPKRRVAGAQTVASADAITAFLRDPSNYPLFGKPIDGKYSLSVISADGYDPAADQVILYGAEPAAPAALARTLAGREAGYVLQRRLPAHRCLTRLFGPRLWSARVIVLMMPSGPVIHRAVAKIATGQNPADNFWRRGNMVGAIDLGTGQVARVIAGTGAEMAINGAHPDTGRPIVGTPIPDWGSLTALREIGFAAVRIFIDRHHAHCGAPAAWRFGKSCWNGGTMVGVVSVGNPVAPGLCGRGMLEVNRLCIRRDVPRALAWNAASMLYGWSARESERRGWLHIVTYTRADEEGASLRAAGWAQEAVVRGRGWHSRRRSRSNRNGFIDKIRWGKALDPPSPKPDASSRPGMSRPADGDPWLTINGQPVDFLFGCL